MAKSTKLDDIRRSALDRAEESERLWRHVITTWAIVEGSCLIVYFLLAYFAFATSVLILVAAVLVYNTLFIGILGLKGHIDISTQRILRAIESLAQDQEESGDVPRTGITSSGSAAGPGRSP